MVGFDAQLSELGFRAFGKIIIRVKGNDQTQLFLLYILCSLS